VKPIIEVESLSKVYRISRESPAAYNALRDEFVRLARLPVDVIRGRRPKKEPFWALRDVSFSVDRGDILGIIGRNGAGKSTLLKILSRITDPSEGQAVLRGKVASLLEVGTGFHPELTGRENIFFNGAILGMTKKDITRNLDAIVDFAEVELFLNTPVKYYSSGMSVRLAFAIAAHLEPDILIVDEVLAVGDAVFQKKSLGKMTQVATEGRTVLFVSHNMRAVQSLCTKALLLEHGEVRAVGNTASTIDQYLNRGQEEVGLEYGEREDAKAQIRRVQLLDADDAPTRRLDIVEGGTVEIVYDVKESLRRAIVTCDFFGTDGVALLATTDSDVDVTPFMSERQPGTYRARIKIPPFTFIDKSFYLMASIQSPGIEDHDRSDELYFDVYSTEEYGRNHLVPAGGHFGYFSTLLEWDSQRL
jgi:lipopolysaccharide transport system ATP-binding protein